jgi:hypothetical protein
MKLTEKEKQIILNQRSDKSLIPFKLVYKQVKKIADSRVKKVKKMSIEEAIEVYDNKCALLEIYLDSVPYLKASNYRNSGYKFTESEFKKLDNIYEKYKKISNDLLKELIEKKFNDKVCNLSDKTKEAIFKHSCLNTSYKEFDCVLSNYTKNLEFLLKCI